MRWGNPFKRMQPGQQDRAYKAPFGGYNWDQALAALRNEPGMSDRDFAVAMGPNSLTGKVCEDVDRVQKYRAACENEITRQQQIEAARKNNQQLPPAGDPNGAMPPPGSDPGTAGAAADSTGVKQAQFGNLTLVTFSPEQLLRQVEERKSRVSFDLSQTAKFMENFNQVWSWLGPILFCLGTIGEIYLVLWSRQTEQTLFAGFSIAAVSAISEGTLLAVSFSSKRLRNRADKRSSGWTSSEKHKLETLKRFWFLLMLCVGATQIAFILSQTKQDGIGLGGIITLAVVRAFAAGVADAYTAFVSEEKPTSGDQALEQQDQENQFTDKLLDQAAKEVAMLNRGAIKVQEEGVEAQERQKELESENRLREERRKTREELERLENFQKIETMKQDYAQRALVDRMRNSAMQAVFDPDMPQEKRIQIISMLTTLMSATGTQLPPPGHINGIDEED
jgi:hypothetical protein